MLRKFLQRNKNFGKKIFHVIYIGTNKEIIYVISFYIYLYRIVARYQRSICQIKYCFDFNVSINEQMIRKIKWRLMARFPIGIEFFFPDHISIEILIAEPIDVFHSRGKIMCTFRRRKKQKKKKKKSMQMQLWGRAWFVTIRRLCFLSSQIYDEILFRHAYHRKHYDLPVKNVNSQKE